MIDLLPNGSVLYQWAIFMIAVGTLHFGIFKPVLHILEKRKARTAGDKETAKQLEGKSDEMMATCEKKLAEAKSQGLKEREARKHIAEETHQTLLKKTREEIEKKMTEIQKNIEHETKEAMLQLRQYAQEVSRDIAAKILEREV